MGLFKQIPTIETERFLLRPLNAADAQAVYEIFSDADVTKDMGVTPFKSIEEGKQLIQFMNGLFEKDAAFRLGIIRKTDQRLIGTCGYNAWEINRGSRVEVAYDLGKPYWRQGIMTEVLTALINFTFTKTDFYRIEAFTNLDALPSMNLLLKSGFVEEGVLRGYASFNDEPVDQRCFSLIKKDWEENSRGPKVL